MLYTFCSCITFNLPVKIYYPINFLRDFLLSELLRPVSLCLELLISHKAHLFIFFVAFFVSFSLRLTTRNDHSVDLFPPFVWLMISAHSEGLVVGQKGKQMSLDEVMKHLEFILYPALIEGQFRKKVAHPFPAVPMTRFSISSLTSKQRKNKQPDVHLPV